MKKSHDKKTRRLARRIVTYLFTPGGETVKADRLALMFGGRDRCGWGYKPAVDRVEIILNRALGRGRQESLPEECDRCGDDVGLSEVTGTQVLCRKCKATR